jgi:hypothetical protein
MAARDPAPAEVKEGGRVMLDRLRRAIARGVYPEGFRDAASEVTAASLMPVAEPMNTTDLLCLAHLLATHTNRSEATLSNLAVGHARLFKRIASGAGCTVRTAERTLQWFSDNWPADLEWPRSIPRPPKSRKEAA